jgi:hypothetical protein
VFEALSNYTTGYSLFSLCELWSEKSEYYVEHIFIDVDGGHQYLLLCDSNPASGRLSHGRRGVLILPLLYSPNEKSIGKKLTVTRSCHDHDHVMIMS